MPVSIEWDNNERTIIRVTFVGRWDAGDLHRIIDKGANMVETVDHKVDSIFDFTYSSFSPQNVLSTVDHMESTHSSNERLIIIVSANIYIRSIAKVGRLLAPKTFAHMHFVETIDSAYAVIGQQTLHAMV